MTLLSFAAVLDDRVQEQEKRMQEAGLVGFLPQTLAGTSAPHQQQGGFAVMATAVAATAAAPATRATTANHGDPSLASVGGSAEHLPVPLHAADTINPAIRRQLGLNVAKQDRKFEVPDISDVLRGFDSVAVSAERREPSASGGVRVVPSDGSAASLPSSRDGEHRGRPLTPDWLAISGVHGDTLRALRLHPFVAEASTTSAHAQPRLLHGPEEAQAALDAPDDGNGSGNSDGAGNDRPNKQWWEALAADDAPAQAAAAELAAWRELQERRHVIGRHSGTASARKLSRQIATAPLAATVVANHGTDAGETQGPARSERESVSRRSSRSRSTSRMQDALVACDIVVPTEGVSEPVVQVMYAIDYAIHPASGSAAPFTGFKEATGPASVCVTTGCSRDGTLTGQPGSVGIVGQHPGVNQTLPGESHQECQSGDGAQQREGDSDRANCIATASSIAITTRNPAERSGGGSWGSSSKHARPESSPRVAAGARLRSQALLSPRLLQLSSQPRQHSSAGTVLSAGLLEPRSAPLRSDQGAASSSSAFASRARASPSRTSVHASVATAAAPMVKAAIPSQQLPQLPNRQTIVTASSPPRRSGLKDDAAGNTLLTASSARRAVSPYALRPVLPHDRRPGTQSNAAAGDSTRGWSRLPSRGSTATLAAKAVLTSSLVSPTPAPMPTPGASSFSGTIFEQPTVASVSSVFSLQRLHSDKGSLQAFTHELVRGKQTLSTPAAAAAAAAAAPAAGPAPLSGAATSAEPSIFSKQILDTFQRQLASFSASLRTASLGSSLSSIPFNAAAFAANAGTAHARESSHLDLAMVETTAPAYQTRGDGTVSSTRAKQGGLAQALARAEAAFSGVNGNNTAAHAIRAGAACSGDDARHEASTATPHAFDDAGTHEHLPLQVAPAVPPRGTASASDSEYIRSAGTRHTRSQPRSMPDEGAGGQADSSSDTTRIMVPSFAADSAVRQPLVSPSSRYFLPRNTSDDRGTGRMTAASGHVAAAGVPVPTSPDGDDIFFMPSAGAHGVHYSVYAATPFGTVGQASSPFAHGDCALRKALPAAMRQSPGRRHLKRPSRGHGQPPFSDAPRRTSRLAKQRAAEMDDLEAFLARVSVPMPAANQAELEGAASNARRHHATEAIPERQSADEPSMLRMERKGAVLPTSQKNCIRPASRVGPVARRVSAAQASMQQPGENKFVVLPASHRDAQAWHTRSGLAALPSILSVHGDGPRGARAARSVQGKRENFKLTPSQQAETTPAAPDVGYRIAVGTEGQSQTAPSPESKAVGRLLAQEAKRHSVLEVQDSAASIRTARVNADVTPARSAAEDRDESRQPEDAAVTAAAGNHATLIGAQSASAPVGTDSDIFPRRSNSAAINSQEELDGQRLGDLPADKPVGGQGAPSTTIPSMPVHALSLDESPAVTAAAVATRLPEADDEVHAASQRHDNAAAEIAAAGVAANERPE